jgi:tetratricopeptide (TPR) repeat protein
MEMALGIVKRLVQREPSNPQYREQEAELERELAVLDEREGRPDLALGRVRASLAVARSLGMEFPKKTEYRRMEARLASLAGDLLKQLGAPHLEEASSILDRSIALWRPLVDGPMLSPTDGPELEIALDSKGFVLRALGQPEEAARVLGEAIQRARSWLVRRPGDVQHELLLAVALKDLGRTLTTNPARSQQAKDVLDEAIEGFDRLARDFPAIGQYKRLLADALIQRAALSASLNGPRAAQADYLKARAVVEEDRKSGADQPEDAYVHGCAIVGLARAARAEDRMADARDLLKTALNSFDQAAKAAPRIAVFQQARSETQAELAELEKGAPSPGEPPR